jgi:ACT domain-containing protein
MHVNRCSNSWRQKCYQERRFYKYKDLIIGIQHMWNVKAKVMLVITGATGSISKSIRQYLSYLQGKLKIKKIQKTVILGTAHKLCANVQVQNIFHV